MILSLLDFQEKEGNNEMKKKEEKKNKYLKRQTDRENERYYII